MRRLDVHFDYGSPYSYLAWHRLQTALQHRDDVQVRWNAVSAGHIFAKEGTQPNMAFPNQARYHLHDVARWAEGCAIPYRQPSAYPQRTLTAARVHHLAAKEDAVLRDRWMTACFEAHWVHDRDLSDTEVLRELATRLECEPLVEAAASDGAKALLAAATDAAYAAGAPGVPFMVLDDEEPFWGNDRIDWVLAWLDGQPAPAHVRSRGGSGVSTSFPER